MQPTVSFQLPYNFRDLTLRQRLWHAWRLFMGYDIPVNINLAYSDVESMYNQAYKSTMIPVKFERKL